MENERLGLVWMENKVVALLDEWGFVILDLILWCLFVVKLNGLAFVESLTKLTMD